MTPSGKIVFIAYLMCFTPLLVFAQQFNYTATLDSVETAGFYSIPISPILSAYIKTDFADIRIVDKKKQWVPHIIQSGRAMLMKELLTQFPILQNSITDSGKNLLIIENTVANGIYSLDLFLKNSAVSRAATISGSNNQRDWFIIDDKISFGRSYEKIKDEYLQEINFPLAKYRYLKIIIDNAKNDPLLITKAGFFAEPIYNKPEKYADNPIPVFIQKDSNNYSYIEVRQDNNYQFDKVSLVVSGPKFYSRDIEICLPGYGINNIARPGIVLGTFKLMSAIPALFELPRTKTSVLFILIKNGDNPLLKIEKVTTRQQIVSMVTYLERGEKYNLMFGDSLASFADYDLQAFNDSISITQPLSYGNIKAIKINMEVNASSGKNNWIWPSIIFAGIMLSFLTYRLMGDVNQSKK